MKTPSRFKAAITFSMAAGVVLCASDPHYLPGQAPSTAHRAFCEVARTFADAGSLPLRDFSDMSHHWVSPLRVVLNFLHALGEPRPQPEII